MAYPDTLPLEGPFRIPLLLIDTTIVFACLLVALEFLKKYRNTRDTVKNTLMYRAWASLFIGFMVTAAIYVISDFAVPSIMLRIDILQYAYFSGATGGFLYVYYVERLTYITKRRIFTIIMTGLYLTLIALMVADHFISLGNIIQTFATSFWIPAIGLSMMYTYKINKLSLGKLKKYSFALIFGFVMLILGLMGATDVMTRIFGLGFRLAADSLQIAGIILITTFALKLPSWKELEWRKAARKAYFIYKGGMLLHEHSFGDNIDASKNSLLIASVLETAKTVLQQSLESGQLKIIDLEDKKIYFQQGKWIMVALVANEQLDSLEFLASKITREFERFFEEQLVNWNGDTDIFQLTATLIPTILNR